MVSLGLALGGGAARGWAHMGVLEALDEEGVDIDMIAGTSFGAVVGSTYCFGSHRDLMEIGKEVDHRRMISFFNLNRDTLNLSILLVHCFMAGFLATPHTREYSCK